MNGRPSGSLIRNRIIAILSKLGSSYGYEIYSIYKKLFGRVHIRSIYYNLKKGIESEEIVVVDIIKEVGDYSWGNEVEKIYYAVGPFAKLSLSSSDKAKLGSLKSKSLKIDWQKKANELIDEFNKDVDNYMSRKDKMYSQSRMIAKSRLMERYNKIHEFIKSKGIDLSKLKAIKNPQTP